MCKPNTECPWGTRWENNKCELICGLDEDWDGMMCVKGNLGPSPDDCEPGETYDYVNRWCDDNGRSWSQDDTMGNNSTSGDNWGAMNGTNGTNSSDEGCIMWINGECSMWNGTNATNGTNGTNGTNYTDTECVVWGNDYCMEWANDTSECHNSGGIWLNFNCEYGSNDTNGTWDADGNWSNNGTNGTNGTNSTGMQEGVTYTEVCVGED